MRHANRLGASFLQKMPGYSIRVIRGFGAHALLQGTVRISQSGSDGAQIVIRFIGSGEVFGVAAAFTDHRYPAGCRCNGAVRRGKLE